MEHPQHKQRNKEKETRTPDGEYQPALSLDGSSIVSVRPAASYT